MIKQYFKKIIKFLFKKKNFEYFYNKGIDFYTKKQYDLAIEFFKLAMEKTPIRPQVYYNIALTYQCKEEYEKAIVSYNKFLHEIPNDYDGVYNLALIYSSMNNNIKAIELLEKCIEIRQDEENIRAYALACISENLIDKIKDFAETLRANTNGLSLYYEVAKAFESKNFLNKDYTFIDQAICMYTKIVESDPQHFDSYLSMSICYAKKGEWENSVKYCKTALQVNPSSYEANNQMGLVFYCCNQISEAVKYYEIALKLQPEGDYKIYSNLAYAYEKIGNKKCAIKTFSQLIKKFPNYPARDEIKNHLRILKAL